MFQPQPQWRRWLRRLSLALLLWWNQLEAKLLVQAKVVETFENAGYSNDITRTLGDFPDSNQLTIDIRRFDISTSGDPEAAVVILAKLQSPDGSIIESRKFEATAPAKGTEPRDYVEALRGAFGVVARDILEWTTKTLAAAPAPADDAASADPPDDFDDMAMPPEPDGAAQ